MISVDDPTTSTVTEKSFYLHFYGVYLQNKEDLEKFPLPVVVTPEWSQPYFTAFAIETEEYLNIGFWGGLARIPGMNDEAVALVTCHEIGHVLAGAPYFRLPSFKRLSSEGQSDYYATSVCLKKYFASLEDTEKMLPLAKPLYRQMCERVYHDIRDIAVCARSITGIEAFSQALAYMQKDQPMPSLLRRDNIQVSETIFDGYPSLQCRLDTLIAGTLSQERPGCWFVQSFRQTSPL